MNGAANAGPDSASAASVAAGTTHASPAHANPELGRVLANIRVIIAVVAAIESLALSPNTRPAMAFAVLCYTAYAGWLGWIEANGSRPVQSSALTSWVDAIWILFLAWLAAAPSSLFILLLLFPVLFAALSYGFVPGLMVSLFAAAGALAVTRAQHGGVMSFETMLFPLSIFGLGPLVAGLARSGVQMNEQISIADRLLDQADPRLGVERVATVILQSLGQRFEADLGLLLVWLPGCEPRLFRGDRSAKVIEVHGELRDALLEALGRLPRGVASAYQILRVLSHPIRRYRGFRVADHLPAGEARPAMDALADLLEARSLAAVPICRRSPQSSWLLLDSGRRRYRAHDVDLLFHIMEQLAPVVENAGLLEQLSDEAVATERARIGRDLHDTAIQPYLGIKYGVEALARKARPDNPLHTDVLALQEMVTSELHQLREVVSSMRTGAARGDDTLAPALRRQAKRFTELFGIEVTVDCEGDIPINRKLSAAFFHLISEALTNIRRHTHATRAEIQVTVEPEAFVLRIGNDHGGAAPPPTPFVPRSIAERAESLDGRAVVDLQRPGFTDLIISIPRHSSGETHGRH